MHLDYHQHHKAHTLKASKTRIIQRLKAIIVLNTDYLHRCVASALSTHSSLFQYAAPSSDPPLLANDRQDFPSSLSPLSLRQDHELSL